ncbi:MAG TPA: aldo/keto reductase [Bacteroidales bacterium]|nr:aldo/keto reductase [Bacteroidales bacterium]
MSKLTLSRRNFLKTSFVGAAGVTIGAKVPASKLQEMKKPGVITRRLGNTDLVLPVVSMGVMRSDMPNLVKAAYDSGIKHFDTAHGYMGGNNEIMLGNVFKDYPRDSFTIATKVHPDDSNRQTGELGPRSTKEAFLEKFNTSLKRLQMDYVDMLYHHGVGSRQALMYEPILDALLTAKKEGKTRYIGLSTHSNEPEVIQAAIDSGVIDVILTSLNFKQEHHLQIKEKIALAAEKGIGIIAMKTMAGAFLDREKTKPINCKAALKWVLQDPNVHTSIPGITSFDMLAENLSVMEDLEFTEEEMKDLREAGLIAGLFCDGCPSCSVKCRRHLPVHDIMRSYMYAYGYNDFKQARDVLVESGIGKNPCEGCESCTIVCPKNFNVAERISDISRIAGIPGEFLA